MSDHTATTDADARAWFVRLGSDPQLPDSPEERAAVFDAWLAEHDRLLIEQVRPKRGRPRSTTERPRKEPPPPPLSAEQRPPSTATVDEWVAWFHSLPAGAVKQRRAELIVLGLRAGLTLERAGSLYGITRERARQIAKQRGVIPTEVKRERKERAARIDTWKKDQIRALSRQHLGMTVDELAALAGLDAEVVRKCLGPRLPIHDGPVEGKVTSQFSDDDLLAFLSDFAANTEHVTIENYNALAQQIGLPGHQTIANRFGRWSNALRAANIELVRPGGLRPVISDTELWATVISFFRSEQAGYRLHHFDSWARANHLPSSAAVKVRLGNWNHIWPTVHRLLRYADRRDGSWAWADEILDTQPGDTPRNTTTRDDALASLRRVAERVPEQTLTTYRYEAARRNGDVDLNSIQRLLGGSWTSALLYADLADRLSPRSRGRLRMGRVPLPDDLREAASRIAPEQGARESSIASLRRVAERAPDGPLTVAVYTEHREPTDAPSTAIVKALGGSWVAALLYAGLQDRLSDIARKRLAEATITLPEDLYEKVPGYAATLCRRALHTM